MPQPSPSTIKPPARKGRPKVKSGCRTCKIRKVKCDEGRPACRRCVSTGRTCDGYGIWGGGSSHSHHPYRQADKDGYLILRPPPSAQPSLSNTQQTYFEWFRCRTSPKLPGSFPSSFWSTLLLQATTDEPSVLHAVLALSSVHKRGPVDTRTQKSQRAELLDEQDRFALQHYVKAISHLQPQLSSRDRRSCRVALITCVVFVCLELLRGHFKTAQVHLQNGLEILRQMHESDGQVLNLKACHEATDEWIVEALSRLHLQVELFRYPYQHTCILQQTINPGVAFARFLTINDAWKYLEYLLNQIFYLAQQARQQEVVSDELFASQQHIKAKLLQWPSMYDTFVKAHPGDGSVELEKSYQILRIQHTMTTIMAETCLQADETVFDMHTDKFILLVEQLANMWAISSKTDDLEVVMPRHIMLMPRSIVDIGWIPPLYFAAVKCRVHRVRLQAIRLLRTSPHREGIWDAQTAACVAQRVMELEEQGFYDGSDTADDFALGSSPREADLSLPVLPESNRLREVEVELSGAPMDSILLLCKKRQQGVDGRVLVSQYDVHEQRWTNGQ
ncbi:hypothetical protein ACJ41O_011541 [Fusarium nematophilum]